MLISKSLLSIACILATSNALELQPTFREGNYKHIAFSASSGGSSHHNWVLSIVDNLGQRGHNISYITTTKETRFVKPYSHVNAIDIGEALDPRDYNVMEEACSGSPMLDLLPKMITLFGVNYERDYTAILEYFKQNNVDLALCDHFMDSCVDAARTLKIPYIVTSTLEMTSESAAPFVNNAMLTLSETTTEFQTFSERFYNKFIVPLKAMYKLYPTINEMVTLKRSVGVDAKFEPTEETWKESLKLVNSYFGYTPARPIGSLAELVGPILPKTYNPLTEDLENYMNRHEKVAYIGFGQNAVPTKKDVNFLLSGLMESLELGYIDGFIWSTYNSNNLFPDTVTTSSGFTYNVQEMFNHTNPHARMMSWTPQTAILLHPSTSVFVSHGGLGSWYESMYAGKPMLMYPFFADQPSNSISIERDGLGYILRRDALIDQITELFKKVSDPNGEIKENVKRIQALTQIRSENGVLHAADIVEEIAYTHKQGVIPHRTPVSNRMSFIKSHNLDLYAALFFILITVTSLVTFSAWKILKGSSNKNQKKMKSL